jgi:sporulation protein YlmC with PRC-barrel domain
MNRPLFAGCLSVGLSLGLATPSLAANPAPADTPSPAESPAVAKSPTSCNDALNAFRRTISEDGFWTGGSDYALGYPMLGYGNVGALGYPDEQRSAPASKAPGSDQAKTDPYATPLADKPPPIPAANGARPIPQYWSGRTGYELRNLLASAAIMARHGEESSCLVVLGSTRDLYKEYVAEMHAGGVRMANSPDWRQRQIAAALPVADIKQGVRSDQLVGTEVRGLNGESLGSVDDLVMSPKTGAIAYLVIGRGGLFGIGEKYVPVPWSDFKAAPGLTLLVLDTGDKIMDAAPKVEHDQQFGVAAFDKESEQVDTYWKAHL